MDIFLLSFIILLIYLLILFVLRHLNIGRKEKCNNCNNCCPDCSSPLNRIKRNNIDQTINHISFRIFDYKRYTCTECGWEGLRWEENNYGATKN